jgi:hypothetical protein
MVSKPTFRLAQFPDVKGGYGPRNFGFFNIKQSDAAAIPTNQVILVFFKYLIVGKLVKELPTFIEPKASQILH